MIRMATEKDIPKIMELLKQVCLVHHKGRSDLFKDNGAAKYTADELCSIISNKATPVFVYADDLNQVEGYAFCKLINNADDNILTDIKTLYIDDLCIDEACRGNHLGTQLYNYVVAFAKEMECYNVTLNVWSCNESAIAFYQKLGLTVQKMTMESIL